MSLRDDLKAFLDGELSPERAAEVQAAIDRDPALRDEVLFMKILSGEIQDASREPQASGADKAVDRVVGRRRSTWKWGAYAASGVAGLFLIGLVGSKLFPNGPSLEAMSQTMSPSETTTQMSGPSDESAKSAIDVPASELDGSVAKTKDSMASGNGQPDVPGEADYALRAGGGGSAGTVGDVRAKKQEAEAPASEEARLTERARRQALGNRPTSDKVTGANTYAQPATSTPGGVEADRKVVRNADMGVKVKDVRKSVAEVERQVNAMNGFVGDTRYDGRQDSSTATMQFQVPEKSFVAMLDTLRRLGTVEHENVSGQDVTATIADGKGRITALADEEQNLIKELARARQSDVRLEIRRRLSSVRQDISGLKAQNKALEGLADMSRVSLTLTQSGQLDEANPNDWFGQTTKGAGDLLGFFGRFIGVGVIYLVFLAPIWLPIVGVVWWMRHRAKS